MYSARARELILGICISTHRPGSDVAKKPERPAIVEIGSRNSGVLSGFGLGIERLPTGRRTTGFAYVKPVFSLTKSLQA